MLISKEEFLRASERGSFKEDKGWVPINPDTEVKDKNLEEFKRHRKYVPWSAVVSLLCLITAVPSRQITLLSVLRPPPPPACSIFH